MRIIRKSLSLIFLTFIFLFQNIMALPVRTGVFLWPKSLSEQGSIMNTVKTLSNNNITDVFILVKGESGATLYPSDYTYSKYYYDLYKKEQSKEKRDKYFQYYETFKDSLFLNKFVTTAHLNNIRVHAWFIVSADKHFIENHPGSEVVHLQDGKKKIYPYPSIGKSHVNLLYPGYKKYFTDQVKKALTIPFDGIMLDKIRYTHLVYTWDNVNTSIALREGVDLNKVLDLAYKTVYGSEDDKEKFVYAYRDHDKDVTQWVNIKRI